MTTATLNTDLFDQIIKHIKPSNFYMDAFALPLEDREANDFYPQELCGTACCIAGWARVLNSANPERMVRTVAVGHDNDPKARRLLGLPKVVHQPVHGGATTPVFYDWRWPSSYDVEDADQETLTQRAKRLLRDMKKGTVKLVKLDRSRLSVQDFDWWAQFSKSRVAKQAVK